MIHLRIGQADDKYPQTLNQFLENRPRKISLLLTTWICCDTSPSRFSVPSSALAT